MEEACQIQISPRRMCECGKTILQLSAKERDAYDEFARRSENRYKKEKEGEVTEHASEQSG